MDRRTFLSLGAISSLFVKDAFALKNNIYVPIDSLSIPKNTTFRNDIYISKERWQIFVNVRDRLRKVKKYVGYGNFNIISFDNALFYGRNYSAIGAFTKAELALLDELFYEDPAKYQFYGDRTIANISSKISKKEVRKIPCTGHYLFKGKPFDDYNQVKKDIGKSIILTSGVRGVAKQMSLYMDKIYRLNGNITQASFSIAPPAYTYHAISDFDVGKKGFGYDNFTDRFAKTKEFKELTKLTYISMRYEINNKDGVGYEPWHVKVI
ncbi:MAG: D-alanyl-D-alanine carboxypeptidase family protein [Arcobacteraceae bacterium]|nr:D-alanyl-D-alanine carboxypeptidase family protein [Arcobacteraceae bacterium]